MKILNIGRWALHNILAGSRVACVILRLAVLVQLRLVTDRRIDGRIDRRTHGDSIYCTSIVSGVKRRITQTTPHNSPGTLLFRRQRSRWSSDGVTRSLPMVAPDAGGWVKIGVFWKNVSLYLWNGARYVHRAHHLLWLTFSSFLHC